MKTEKKLRVIMLFFIVCITTILTGCKSDDDGEDMKQPVSTVTSGDYTITFFKNQTGDPNADALQAQIINTAANFSLNFYGTFDANNDPAVVHTLSLVRFGNDTVVYFSVNSVSGRIETAFYEIGGIKQQSVVKYSYVNGNDNALKITAYNYNWSDHTSELQYEALYENFSGTVSGIVIFNGLKQLRQMNGFFGDFISVMQSIALSSGIVYVCCSNVPVIIPVIGVVSAIIALIPTAINILIPAVQADEIIPGTNPPNNNTPIPNPAPPSVNPLPYLPQTTCESTFLNFSVSMDQFGSIAIWGVTGGTPPYKFSVGSAPFQTSPIFNGPYGNGMHFIKVKDNNDCVKYRMCNLCSEIVTDIDGNVYHMAIIGNQTWLTSNLKVKHYRNGDPIPNVTDDSWFNLTSGAYCNWHNNVSNGDVYGCLYNAYAFQDSRGLCPTGWHVPSDQEWLTLRDYLGGDLTASWKLRETGPDHWGPENWRATNESGFTALPGGWRWYQGPGDGFGGGGAFWWTSTEGIMASIAVNPWPMEWYFILDYSYSPKLGISIRCIRD